MAQVKAKDLVENKSGSVSSNSLIFVVADKGGTGKSTLTRAVVDILHHRQIDYLAYDGDKRNSQLFRHYHNVGSGVHKLDFSVEGGADGLIEAMDGRVAPVIVVDLPGGGVELLEQFDSKMSFLADAGDMGYAVTMVSVLSRIKDSVNALRLLMDLTGDSAQHIAVKNLYWGDEQKFSLFDSSATKQRLLNAGGLVMNMPDLFDDTYSIIDEHSLSFRAAVDDTRLTRPHRSRVNQWLRQLESQIELADKFLGVKEV
jgi:energy-coupling factor transporter ATP-binding protein EcfA2